MTEAAGPAKAVRLATIELLQAVPAFVTAVDYHRSIKLDDAGRERKKYVPPSMAVTPKPFEAESLRPHGGGLMAFRNPDSACFVNSVMTALVNVGPSRSTLGQWHPQCGLSKNCGMCALLKLVKKEDTAGPVTIAKTSFGKLFNIYASEIDLDFSGKVQNDPVLVMTHLMRWLTQTELESQRQLRAKRRRAELADEGKLVYEVEECLLEMTSTLGRMVSFVTVTRPECRDCGKKGQRKRAVNWMLPVYKANSLRAAVNSRFDDSKAGDVCEGCGSDNVKLSQDFESTPRCMILQVIGRETRFTDCGSVVELSSERGLVAKLRVCAAVLWEEGKEGGAHFSTAIRRDEKFWHVDDDRVRQLKSVRQFEKVCSAPARLLFCENLEPAVSFIQHETPLNDLKFVPAPQLGSLVEEVRALSTDEQVALGYGLDRSLHLDVLLRPA